ncbi:hypothetical protein L1785_15550 [Antribacter sp. KLBMP9083]|uniref:MinD-like ATPase involved in chromosome partitioning or flagellar assembly n=1 Tax=Antribacter soli TaxID=2910976 RepID=A0AA41QFW8_9MICO|nr:hypothetical protein [Antribacter soli]MCF4122392.1 hypothetical protein [Antribacter soli]
MTERVVTVLCAVRGPDETAVVTVLGAAGAAVTVTRRCAELAELLAAAEAGAGVVAVVSVDLPGLDREAVARLRRAGTRVVVLADGHASAGRVSGLGPDAVVPGWPVDPEGLLAAVRDETVAGPTVAEPPVPDGGRPGAVVAVWGPAGSPGRTTTAIELAAALAGLPDRAGTGGAPTASGVRLPTRPGAGVRARRGRRPTGPRDTVLLVDADTYASSVATRLGLLDDAPGLAAAARAAGQGVLDLVTLARHSPVALPGVRVLTGITRPARWPELPASALEVVWERARELVTWTVVDCGPVLEADELLMYDTHAPQRNAATLAALAAADVVVVVGAADPVGLQRLVRGLEDLREAPVAVAGVRVVVANRVRAGAAGPRPEAAVRDALARYAGVVDLHVVPDDPAGADAALLAGRALAERVPGSPARAAFAALAERVRGLVPAARSAIGPATAD